MKNKIRRTLENPDRLSASEIMNYLPEECLCRNIECFNCLDSTNTRAKQFAEAGEPEGTLIVSEKQTAGRGRRGRSWSSESEEGIYMSFLLRPNIPTQKVSALTLLSALAVVKAIKEICSVEAEIKWPNDVMIAKKKICGILTEMSSEENDIRYVIVGMGINANTTDFPEEIKDTAGSVYLQTGKKVNRCELTAAVIRHFCNSYERFCKEQSLASFVEEYNAVLVNRDKEVRIYYGMVENSTSDQTDTGIARGIDSEGALLAEVDGKIQRIISGEVSVRGLYGYV